MELEENIIDQSIANETKQESLKKENIFVYISLLFLFISIGVFVLVDFILLPQKEKEISALNVYAEEIKESSDEENKKEFSLAQKYISDFILIKENSFQSIEALKLFESLAHPYITYSSFNLKTEENKITVSGKTLNNRNLMEQITILNTKKILEKYNISNVKIDAKGEISFNMDLYFSKELIKK